MTTSDFTDTVKELDARTADGIDVRLFWHPVSEAISIAVFDSTREEVFEFVIEPGDALDAFNHPFAYAAFQGIPFQAPVRAHDEAPISA